MSEVATLDLGGNEFFEKVYEEHLTDRKIIINEDITADIIERLILQIMKFNKQDIGLDKKSRKPIFIYMNSAGGDVLTGLTSIDIIRNSKTPIIGVCLGYSYSMGCLMFISCHKRIMLPSASLLIHDGSMSLSGSSNKVKDLQKFYSKLDDKIKDIVVDCSKITSDEYDQNMDRELYLIAEECKEKGLCDLILGQDCDITDII